MRLLRRPLCLNLLSSVLRLVLPLPAGWRLLLPNLQTMMRLLRNPPFS